MQLSVGGTWRWRVCAAAAGLALSVNSTVAETASFSIPTQGAWVPGDTNRYEISLDGGRWFVFSFVLPRDYQARGKVRIVLHLSSPTVCRASLVPRNLVRTRIGVPILDSLTGLRPQDGSATVDFPSANVVVAKVFTVQNNPAFGGQRRGDGLTVGIGRVLGEVDACERVLVHAIEIRYPRAAEPDPAD